MSPTKDKRTRERKRSPRDATDAELAERLIGIADADPGLSGREQAVIDESARRLQNDEEGEA